MSYGRWKKRQEDSKRKDAGFLTLIETLEQQEPDHTFEPVPNWEKRFCSQMKWKDFCDKKRIVHLFPKVLNWDDSAGKEAFDNAKARYWAEINNLPSEIPLPDPDMYVQEVDYNAYIHPSLLKDLYKSPPPPPPPKILDLNSFQIKPTGWDVVDPSPSDNIPEFIIIKPSTADDIVDSSSPIMPAGWGDGDNQNSKIDTTAESITIIPTGWGDEEDSQGRQLNCASTLSNTEKNVDHGRGWQQNRRNDYMFFSKTFNSGEHHEHRNGARRDKRYGRRGGDGSFCSNHANLRCHDQDYLKDRWTKYNKEQYFWRQKSSLGRGVS